MEAHSKEELYARIKWLMISRFVLVLFLLGSLLFFQYRYHIYEVKVDHLVFFFSTVCALSALYWYLITLRFAPSILAYIQILVDVILITWLVALTGSIDSSFTILYHIVIISASIIFARRGGYSAASVVSILYGGLLDVQYYNAFGFTRSQSYTAGQVLFLLFVNIVSFYVVAFLSGYLSERLRRTRQELQEKSSDFEDLQALQNHILRSVGSGIVTMDMTGKVTSWNNAAEAITGYGLEEIRQQWNSVFGECIKNIFGHAESMRSGPLRFEGKIAKKDAAPAILGFTASLLKDENERVGGIILTFQDITRLVEMEERLRRQDRLATVGSLAAGIAHEIRNPLASLSGSIQMLREGLLLSDDNKNLMDIVLRETDRLNTIITDFLDYARPKKNVTIEIPLASLIRDTVVLFKNSRMFHESIQVSIDIEDDLCVQGDSARLRQVIWNLLNNSAQAILQQGTISICARATKMDSNDPAVSLIVKDTGVGIAPESLGTIFAPFFTTKADGTGLGLAIVYRIVEDHGGTIDVESELGVGTVFKITFPVKEMPISEIVVDHSAGVRLR